VWQVSPIAESLRMQTLAGGECWNSVREDMRLERIATETGAILYDPSRLDHPTPVDFDPAALAEAGRVTATATGRGSAWFIAAPHPGGGATVLRHYRRGGWIARWVADRYLWRGEEATRAFRELRLLAAIEALGLPAARPVAARYLRSGLGYRADLLTVAIAGAEPLAARLEAGLAPAEWRRIGATIRAFHDAGVCHADLNARNVLLDAGGAVHLIDFDRGSLAAPGPWCEANLARLRRSLLKLRGSGSDEADPAGWSELVAGYRTPRSAPPR
jgi:3-deoxy-D-manno-octulosonic acid kinase